ncbi:MAG: M48 family metalloprotease [Gemmatimonadales bacterium]
MKQTAPQARITDLGRRRLAVALAGVLVAGCAMNPATGQNEFNLVSESQEVAMGMEAAQQVAVQMGPYEDPVWQPYVSKLGLQLAASSERPQLPWKFTVVDDPQVNAFALPGGFIYITRGILANMNSEAELAGVLGHEIGHVTARHSATQMSRAQLAQLGLGLGAVLRPELQQYMGVAGAGLQLLFLKYTRDDESQADMLGFRYSLRSGYDPHAMLDLFTMLEGVESASGQERLPAWAVTHPYPENRLAQTQRMLDSAKVSSTGLIWNRETYVRQLDGMVYGADPRQGYFDGQAFYHPELKLQLLFPAGWRTNNGFSAVTGLAEQQDGLLQLELGSTDAIATQLQAFLAQPGVTPGSTSSASINGLPAVSAPFSATLEDGSPVRGRIAILSYGGRSYRLMGIAKEAQAAAYDPIIQGWIRSFRPLTDAARLNVSPARIRIVKLSAPMTVSAFNAKYPSTVPIGQVALLNGVAVDGSFPAGKLVKRVVK